MSLVILTFVSVTFLIFAIYYNIEYRRGQWIIRKRMSKYDKEHIQIEETKSDNFFVKLLRSSGSIGKPKSPEEISSLQKTFLQAGFRKDISMIFFGSKVWLAVLLPIVFIIVKGVVLKTMPTLQFTIVILASCLVGFYLPNVWIKKKVARRKDRIFKGFPDALDLMVVCVEAGTGLDSAITKVGDELSLSNKDLSNEFKLLSLELRAGKARKEALQNLALRCDLDDVSSLVTLLIQTDKFGTSVAQALRVYSDSMRNTRQQNAEEQAAKLPVKLIFPLALFLLPSLFVVLLGPGVVKMFKVLPNIVIK